MDKRRETKPKKKKNGKVALSDCVHKAVVIVCRSSVGAPREASLTGVMARRPHALTGPPEYKREATRSQGEGSIDAGDLFVSGLCNGRPPRQLAVAGSVQPQTSASSRLIFPSG